MIRVLIADDHAFVRLGLSTYLQTVGDMEVVGEAEHGHRAVELGLSLKPDVILMDLLMPGISGVEAIRELAEGGCTSRIVVLTSSVDDGMVLAAIRAGAFSYILKTSSAEQLAQAIRQAVLGYPTFDGPVQRVLLGHVQGDANEQPLADLTDREMDVLKGIASGKSNQEIAEALGIGIKTVKTHVSNILMKLDVQDRTQAAIYAIRHNVV